ncbi:hypothetical protein PF004_g18105 [Phytophthora fragariae]|uniref:Glycosyltransferase 61 catalytic domain-containing protein n=2 Tax=Phytophthora fragariae TaxID=53985 RepID=A0A6G0NDH4_9STRA|nr:hypothetical protein PF004_g18105 [Phytophthora fragariae]
MVARPLNVMKKVSPNSGASSCSKRRMWLWGGLVSAMVLVSFLNVFETLTSFQFVSTSSGSSSDSVQVKGPIESTKDEDLQMFPVGVRHFQHAIHHQVRDEFEDDEQVDETRERMASPVRWPSTKGSKSECLYARDYGLIERLGNSSRTFCTAGARANGSTYTFFHVPEAGVRATKLQNFGLDLRGAEIAQDIDNLADDGGGHDPRFRYRKSSAFCSCVERQDREHGAPSIWKDYFAGGPSDQDPNCDTFQDSVGDKLTLTRAVVMVRKDDHNPFFQISAMLNAWVMMKTIGWDRNTTQLVTLDRALPSPVDDLRHALLGPERPVIDGEVFQDRVVHFESALLPPYEVTGPLMSHLDDNQPCHANAMIADFRDAALKSMAVTPHNAKSDPQRCLVTIISRRPYGGRRIQRVWQNEDEIVGRMRAEYRDAYRFGECEFQSLEFTNMTMHDQMRAMVDSDVVIGMHGAGMVKVMWTRPETLVIEIFPRRRYRWGYRNLCQYLGCKWHEFRSGRDVRVHTFDPNDMDKFIPFIQWRSFFDPLFRDVVDRLEEKVGGS